MIYYIYFVILRYIVFHRFLYYHIDIKIRSTPYFSEEDTTGVDVSGETGTEITKSSLLDNKYISLYEMNQIL